MIGFALDRNRKRDLNVIKPFYEDMVDVLNFLRSGTSEFLTYVQEVNISALFRSDEEYTVFVPMDDSFLQWYPIDWGFNPFLVDKFVHETILNHFADESREWRCPHHPRRQEAQILQFRRETEGERR